jgi:hypothetical protein
MRPFLRTLAAVTLLALPAAAGAQTAIPSQTLTARDLVALNQAGLGDDVLIALIEANYAVFDLGYAEVLSLRKQGLSERVLIKMIESKTAPRKPVRAATQVAPRPPPVVVTQTVTQEVHVEAPRRRRTEYVKVPVHLAVPVRPRQPVKAPEPEYWGFGGKRRPDSWQESKDPKKDSKKKKGPKGSGQIERHN